MYPNRVVAVATAALTLALAILPVIGDMDWTSTAGVIAGIVAVLGITRKWLEGWQAHEARAPQQFPSVWTSSSGSNLTVSGNTFSANEEDEGPGDPDALPHFPAKNPDKIPPDEGDAGGTS